MKVYAFTLSSPLQCISHSGKLILHGEQTKNIRFTLTFLDKTLVDLAKPFEKTKSSPQFLFMTRSFPFVLYFQIAFQNAENLRTSCIIHGLPLNSARVTLLHASHTFLTFNPLSCFSSTRQHPPKLSLYRNSNASHI